MAVNQGCFLFFIFLIVFFSHFQVFSYHISVYQSRQREKKYFCLPTGQTHNNLMISIYLQSKLMFKFKVLKSTDI